MNAIYRQLSLTTKMVVTMRGIEVNETYRTMNEMNNEQRESIYKAMRHAVIHEDTSALEKELLRYVTVSSCDAWEFRFVVIEENCEIVRTPSGGWHITRGLSDAGRIYLLTRGGVTYSPEVLRRLFAEEDKNRAWLTDETA